MNNPNNALSPDDARFLDNLLRQTPLPDAISVDQTDGISQLFRPSDLLPGLRLKLPKNGVRYNIAELVLLESALSFCIGIPSSPAVLVTAERLRTAVRQTLSSLFGFVYD